MRSLSPDIEVKASELVDSAGTSLLNHNKRASAPVDMTSMSSRESCFIGKRTSS